MHTPEQSGLNPLGHDDGVGVRMRPPEHNEHCWLKAYAHAARICGWEESEARAQRAVELLADPAECKCADTFRNRGRRR